MQPVLRLIGGGWIVVALGLWFFGGMNLGPTSMKPEPVIEPTLQENNPRGVVHAPVDFRPGPGFVLGSCVLATGLFYWAHRLDKNGAHRKN
jgi:hypothetical protein